ncbi:MAG: arginine deiminase-related protein, partial [Thermodesulfovibrionales bacterium]|nr:arginine deiminase-related protein [Thermodesulfovibrionales bacterium]
FPNNWVSFHHDGTVVLYPMFAENRRLERRLDIIDKIKEQFEVSRVVDYSSAEKDNKYFAHVFCLFSDVPASDFLAFIKKYDISLPAIKKYYFKHVKKFYPNTELENVFTFK